MFEYKILLTSEMAIYRENIFSRNIFCAFVSQIRGISGNAQP